MEVTVIFPLREAGVAYRPGETFETKPSRGWRLAELGLVKAPPIQSYDYRTEWTELRQIIGARPEGIIQFKTRRSRLDQLRPGETLLLIRKYGGLGDILIQSMMLPDLRNQFPEVAVTYAPPRKYHALFEGSGITLRAYEEVFAETRFYHRGGVRADLLDEYDLIEDLSIPCHVWENLFAMYGGVDGGHGLKWRNRLDMWSRWIGLTPRHPRTCITIRPEEREAARRRLKARSTKPPLIFAPFAANVTKSYPWMPEVIAGLSEDWTVFTMHDRSLPPDLGRTLTGLTIRQMGAACAEAAQIVAVDTSVFHWGGILGRPTLGLFNVNDGAAYARYYPTVRIMQCCDTPCLNTKYRTCGKLVSGNLPVIPGLGHTLSRCYQPDTVGRILEALRHDTA